MNLRLLLVLLTVLSYVAIGVTWFLTNPSEEVEEAESPYFYTVSPDDLRNIEITTGDEKASWSLREDGRQRRWYFDNLNDIPANPYRWGGITQLLGGPRTKRVLGTSNNGDSRYGLDNPSTTISVTLRDQSKIKLILGGLTPDGINHYARLERVEGSELVLVDASWGGVLERLVYDPPVPEWYYTLSGDVREVILFTNNEVLRAYGFNRDEELWYICTVPLETDPCTGTQLADSDALNEEIEHFGNPIIDGAIALGLDDDDEYIPFGTTVNSPYIAIRVENKNASNVTEVTRLTMTIGDKTKDGKSRYAVANETSDVIAVDLKWADRVLDLFFGKLLVADK